MLENKVAVVTGGARAMGRVIAEKLADEGASLAVLAPETELLDEAASSLQRAGNRCLALNCDVADESSVAQCMERVADELGEVEILVNNAGIAGPTAPVQDVELPDWNRTIGVNLTGALLCSQSVLPGMLRRESGRIINISSMAGRLAFPLRSPYAASKWGLVGLTLCLAKEVGSAGIQVNAICPGPVAGDRINDVIANKARETGRSFEDMYAEFVDDTLLKRMVTQDDIAAMVVYLCSPAGAAITGQALEVSAGYGL